VPKLGVFSGAEIVRIMESAGFIRARQKGGHAIMQRRFDGGTITVPVPLHRTVRTGMLQSIIRQSGIPREQFLFEIHASQKEKGR
jgi:predicted RNA binding protein YcfA (HicA-like mRNA interferase family)